MHRKKLDATSRKVIFVGYQGDSNNYRLFDTRSRKITHSRNVTFNEEGNPDLPDSPEYVPLPSELFRFLDPVSELSTNETIAEEESQAQLVRAADEGQKKRADPDEKHQE